MWRRLSSSAILRALIQRHQHVVGCSSSAVASGATATGSSNTLTLKDFLKRRAEELPSTVASSPGTADVKSDSPPYIDESFMSGHERKVYFETYGCQMNVNDTEIARSVLLSSGYTETRSLDDADVVLLMTCAIRESAEAKIWHRIDQLQLRKHMRRKRNPQTSMKIGLLGCMAERLRGEIIERAHAVDVVCGPDAYRDLPRLLAQVSGTGSQTAVNVLLSLDETYADVQPIRMDENAVTAFVSIMRGCDNMCTYCIVPFTRGRERSRPIDSIIDEVRRLSDTGVKEITLLGQNVNSYRDLSESVHFGTPDESSPSTLSSESFRTVYRTKVGGRRFADLLDSISLVNPEMRIRFTSPHPKDFPCEVLDLIAERPNICKQIHLPAQSGNSEVLDRMGRGYTRETYLELVHRMREKLPGLALTSDFIAGFCGETEQAHKDSLDLIRRVGYSMCYCFPYSMREKTRAFRRLNDDVPVEVKKRRSIELVDAMHVESLALNESLIGSEQLVLIERKSKRSAEKLSGRNDLNLTVILPQQMPNGEFLNVGDYVVVRVTHCSTAVLHAVPIEKSTVGEFVQRRTPMRTFEERVQKRQISTTYFF